MKVRQIGRKPNIHRVFTMENVWEAACLFFLFFGIALLGWNRSGTEKPSEKKIFITAHRGASHGAPENTEASIALAITEGADYAEIDVRMTSDGVPVLLHDRGLFRTAGVVKEIDKVTYRELTSYDIGRRYAKEFSGERVPRLQDVLEEYGSKILFNIELKENNRKLAEEVVTAIERYGLENRCVVTSVFYEQLELVKERNPVIRTGYILSLVYGEVFGYEAADFFSVKAEYITEQLVKGAHEKGKEIHAWTVNNPYEITRMQVLGVDNIITDNPAYVRDVLP